MVAGAVRRGAAAVLVAAAAVLGVAASSNVAERPVPAGAPRPAPEPAPAAAPLPAPAGIVGAPQPAPAPPASPAALAPRAPATAGSRPSLPPSTTVPAGTPVEVAYRLERRTSDPATAGFEAFAQATLADPRGWGRAGFRLVHRADAPFRVVLAEGPEVDALCLPYDTYGQYSCQNGPTVALNADRWRTATPKWTGTLDDYRRYLVGHEVGHLLGLNHPRTQCPAPGRRAPLLAQQSTELDGCLPNPWPLDSEIELARRRPADLAHPYRP